MAKVITRSEVNALVEGTFTTDLNKAVLYGEISGNTGFVTESVNSVSDRNYTQNQALLDTDIRASGGPTPSPTTRVFKFTYNDPATVTNDTPNEITFQRVSEGTLPFGMAFPNSTLRLGFDGQIIRAMSTQEIGLTDVDIVSSTTVTLSSDNPVGEVTYQFVGTKEDDQKLTLTVTYENSMREQKVVSLAPENNYTQTLNLGSWFDTGETVNVGVTFAFTVISTD